MYATDYEALAAQYGCTTRKSNTGPWPDFVKGQWEVCLGGKGWEVTERVNGQRVTRRLFPFHDVDEALASLE